jgi:tetratricopeptide (TPR) repeat protein
MSSQWITLLLSMVLILSGCVTSPYQPAVSTLLKKALILKESGQTQQALTHLQIAEELIPEAYEVQYNLGVLYLENNQFEKAIIALEKAVTLQANAPNAWYVLGSAYETSLNTMPPTHLKRQETLQKTTLAYQHYLDSAPASDPNRSAVVSWLKGR